MWKALFVHQHSPEGATQTTTVLVHQVSLSVLYGELMAWCWATVYDAPPFKHRPHVFAGDVVTIYWTIYCGYHMQSEEAVTLGFSDQFCNHLQVEEQISPF